MKERERSREENEWGGGDIHRLIETERERDREEEIRVRRWKRERKRERGSE